MSFPFVINGFEGNQFHTGSTKLRALGTIMEFPDGRRFRYCSADASTATVPGKLYQSPLPSNQTGRAVSTYAAGEFTLAVTFGGAVTADQYADGYLWADASVDFKGITYRIKSHPAGTSDVPVALWTATQTAFAAADTVSLIPNPYAGVVITGSPATASIVGVACQIIAVSAFGWLQTRGPCPVLEDSQTVQTAIAKSVTDGSAGDTDGSVAGPTAGGDDAVILGQVMGIESDAQYDLIWLTIE